MAKSNSKVKIFVSFVFVFGLFVLAYFLLWPNFNNMFNKAVNSSASVEGKGVQYRFEYTGQGDKTNIINLNKGPVLFEIYHEGPESFYADLRTSDDKLVSVLVDTKGNYDKATEFNVPETDAYIVTIRTTGSWGYNYK